jgi:hypothetical protein
MRDNKCRQRIWYTVQGSLNDVTERGKLNEFRVVVKEKESRARCAGLLYAYGGVRQG